MQTLWQDLRYGLRTLVKKPSFTLIAIITLGLGIGANSTIFSFFNGILLRPLPYQEPERLVQLDETSPKRGGASMAVSFPNFLDWRAQNQVFSDIAAYQGSGDTLTGTGEPEQLSGARASQGLFEILGVSPLVGRTFTAEEDQPERDLVVILGHGLWQRRFGGDPEIIGQTILLNNRPRVVIGVMPPDFKFPEVAELWTPLALDTRRWTRNDHGLGAIARLKPGVPLAQAQEEMSAIARRIEEQNPVTNEGMGVNVINLRDQLVGDYREGLWILLAVVGFVLLIACANVANLLLARAAARQKEIAIRAALGAGRWRIIQQMLCESVLLGALGGVLGLIIAWWGLDLLLAAIPIKLPFWMKFNVDANVLGFTLAISLLTGLVFGAAPALQAAHANLNDVLKEGGRGGVGGGRSRLRHLLVVAEVAIALVLLAGAGLMMRSFLRLQQVNPGLNPDNVLTLRVSLPQVKYRGRSAAFYQQLTERVNALPGVEVAGAIVNLPLSERPWWGRSLTVEGRPLLPVGQAPMINNCVITPHYFRAMGIPLLEGRAFTDADSGEAPKVTIIDERLAREYWPGQSPLGKRIRFGPPEDNEPWHTIVGVVGEVQHERLDLTVRRNIYLPYAQNPVAGMSVAVRCGVKPEALAASVRGQVKEMDPDLPVTRVMTMNDVIAESVWRPRLYAILFAAFAAVALLLAGVGIYGVMSYAVSARTNEIGIRVALGAQTGDVMKLVVGQGMALTMSGVGLGLLGALLLTRLMKTLLFGVSTTDPPTFAAIASLLASVALLACYLPARRATKVDPMVALRCE